MNTRRCRVSGRLVGPDGTPLASHATVQASRRGMWNGAMVMNGVIRVSIDQTTGKFAVELIPSEVVGTYTLRVDRERFTFDVPRVPAADFADLLSGAAS